MSLMYDISLVPPTGGLTWDITGLGVNEKRRVILSALVLCVAVRGLERITARFISELLSLTRITVTLTKVVPYAYL